MTARMRLNVKLQYIVCIILSEVYPSNNLSVLYAYLCKFGNLCFIRNICPNFFSDNFTHTIHRLHYYEDDVQPTDVYFLNSNTCCFGFFLIPSNMALLSIRIVPSTSTLTREMQF